MTRKLLSVSAMAILIAACGGGGGGGGGFTPPPPPPPVTGNVNLSGRITFDRPSNNPHPAHTLNFNNLQRLPARGVTVEVLRSSDNTVLATTVTDSNGNYAAVFAATAYRVRAKAQMVRTGAGSYDFEVLNNTASNALYVLDSNAITPTSNTMVTDLNAATGWGGSSYTGTRAAAPFALLDMVWRARELIQAAESGLALPALKLYWSATNRAGGCANGDPNPVTGEIGTSFYLPFAIPAGGGCPATPAGIYILGDASGNADDDTDEFDASVVAHEFGHYYEDKVSRSDSMGGPHALDLKLDFRIAMSEGWGNAFQGMVMNDPFYRDTFGASGNQAFFFDLENDNSRPFAQETGFFSEASTMDFLWDAFDLANDPGDTMSFGFGPIHTVMRNEMRTTEAMVSIYPMATALAARNPGTEASIRNRLAAEMIFGFGDFATGETSSQGDPGGLPVYRSVVFSVTQQVTSINQFADPGDTDFASYNRQGGRRYLRIIQPATTALRVQLAGGTDPDFALYRRGVLVCEGVSSTVGSEDQLCPNITAGSYVLEVAECTNLGEFFCGGGPPRGSTVINVTVTQQ